MSEIDIETMKKALSFSKTLMLEIDRLSTQRPYHLNVIDELHINENGHSRILYKLLTFRNEKGEYEILQSFISFLKKKYHRQENIGTLDNIKILHPEITQEIERIDLWVREKDKYALIFENKACGANDTEAQLYRYIKKTKDRGFKEEQIFIFYLPQTKDSDPSEQTWGGEKEKFSNRYFKVPFREDILQWLENDVLQNIRHKDFMLLTAITQYVDYLKGYFDFRNNKETKMEQQELINKVLGLNDKSKIEKLNLINEKADELLSIVNALSQYRDGILEELRQEEISRYKSIIEKDFMDFCYCYRGHGGVHIDLDGTQYILFIEKDSRWYCQLELEGEDEKDIKCDALENSGIRSILSLPGKYTGPQIWKYMKSGDSIENAYNCMKEVIEKVREYKNLCSINHHNEQS